MNTLIASLAPRAAWPHGLAFLLLLLSLPPAVPAAIVDGPDAAVNALAQGADGTVYLGGAFQLWGAQTGGFAALNATTAALDRTFPRVNGELYATAPDGAGGWYLGGTFSSVGGVARANLAHVDASGAVTAWNPGTSGTVNALAVSGTTVYAGGVFTTVCPSGSTCWNGSAAQTRNNLAAFDGAGGLLAWNPGTSGTVNALAVSGTTVYAGGAFTTVCPSGSTCYNNSAAQTRNRLAAFGTDGSLLAWNPDAGGAVNALAVSGTTVYVGGDFTSVCTTAASTCWNGSAAQTRRYVAAIDSAGTLLPWNPAPFSKVWALAVSGTTVYVGGEFTAVCTLEASTCYSGTTFPTRNRLAAFNSAGVLLNWSPSVGNTVYALAVSGTTVYVGGGFTLVNAVTRNRLAALGTTDGSLTAWNPNASDIARTLAVSGETVYAGGKFKIMGGQARDRLAAVGADGILTAWNPGASSTVSALAVSGTTIYAGGNFTAVCTTAASTCWNGSAQTRNRLAAFGSNGILTTWNPGANSTVSALAVSGTTVYAGGAFTAVCTTAASTCWNGTAQQPRNRLAAFNTTDGTVTTWDPNVNNTVNALAVSGTTLYVGGSFTSVCATPSTCYNNIAAQPRNRLAAFSTTDGSLSTTWNPDVSSANSTVNALAVSGATVYAGGLFTTVGGQSRNNLAAIGSDGAVSAWNPGASALVRALAVNGSTIHAGGDFTTVCPSGSTCYNNSAAQTRNRLAAFGTDGSLLAWNPDAGGAVNALAANGPAVYAGGAFTEVANERLAAYPVAYVTALAGLPCGAGLPLTTSPTALWQQLALPCVPSPASVANVFGSGTLSNLTTADYGIPNPGAGTGWVIDRREVSTTPSSYVRLTKDDALNVGTGYWIKSYQAPTGGQLSVTGSATPAPVTQGEGCAVAAGCQALTVTTVSGGNRYNLVGNPFPYAIDWSQVRVRVGGVGGALYSPCQAAGMTVAQGCSGPAAAPASPPVLSNVVSIWNGADYDTFSDLAPTQGNLQYFKSFWVNVLPGAAGQTVELLIPAAVTTLPLGQAAPDLPWYLAWLDWVAPPAAAAPAAPSASAWTVRLQARNHVTGWQSAPVRLGRTGAAQPGYDGHDLPKLPPFGTPYLSVVFPHPDWGARAGDYATDFRPYGTRRADWAFEVRADPAGAVVFLNWEGDPALLRRSRLIDRQTGQVIQPTAARWARKGYPITLKHPVQRYVWRYLGP